MSHQRASIERRKMKFMAFVYQICSLFSKEKRARLENEIKNEVMEIVKNGVQAGVNAELNAERNYRRERQRKMKKVKEMEVEVTNVLKQESDFVLEMEKEARC